ncbi:MAG: class I SAM-dependent methyltransferase [Planctomycetales bacterium]|nr:class I SAM-dependent methyltransferase [Planctomycetales bacterium]
MLRHFGCGRVLDVGAGEKGLVAALVKEGIDAHGFECSPEANTGRETRLTERFQAGSVLHLPHATDSFDTVLAADFFEFLAPEDILPALQELRRVARRNVVLKIALGPSGIRTLLQARGARGWWERACFEVGLRKHPEYYAINDYSSLQNDGEQIVVPLEKVPDAALAEFPLARLAEERGLHMDMLRESGSRSDAHVHRYHQAVPLIRPGDVVLDAACGLGYGSYLLSCSTLASQVIGIDSSEYAIRYASLNFEQLRPNLQFRPGFLPDALASIPDHSVDTVISYETLEHVADPEGLLREFHRLLTPGGRVIVSVPNDWRDETGKDPNPYHLHVYNADKIRAQIAESFDIERVFAQTANRAKRLDAPLTWVERPRSMVEITENATWQVETEWWIVVGAKSVRGGEKTSYIDRVYSAAERDSAENALAFERDYNNPWLVRAMVSIGLRTENPRLLQNWANQVLELQETMTPDYGAALCVLAYRSLDSMEITVPGELNEAIQDYLDQVSANPNVLRWQVSLSFVQAQMALRAGNRPLAKQLFARTLHLPAGEYSPTLLTKTAEAAWHLGLLEAGEGESIRAQEIWKTTADRIRAEIGAYLTKSRLGNPPDFLYREIAYVMSLVSRLTTAAKYGANLKSQPRIFYNAIHADPIALHAYIKELSQSKDFWEKQARESQLQVNRLESSLPKNKRFRSIISREFSRLVRQGRALWSRKSA